jgi:hypothetical protein
LYGKDRASVEELISNRAGKIILPYEIVFNDDVDWELKYLCVLNLI